MMDSVNSTTFIKRPPCMTETQEKFLYTKEVLSGRIFMGYYRERHYVSALKEYRDVVVIHSEETELTSDIDKIRKKWMGVQNIKWVGITGPDTVFFPKAYCFWVKLTNLAFGQYWFQIKYVKLVDEEIVLHLKCIRKAQVYHSADVSNSGKPILECKNEKSEPGTSVYSSINKVNLEFAKGAISNATKNCNNAMAIILPHITWRNLLLVLKVTCALTLAFVMGFITFIGHLSEYLLKLIRELSLLVNAVTPIIVQLIDFFSKLLGGIYILLAGVLGRNVVRFDVQPNDNNILFSNSRTPAVDWRTRNQMLRKELLSSKITRGKF